MQAAAQAGDVHRVQEGCEAISAALAEAQRVLARMEEKVSDYFLNTPLCETLGAIRTAHAQQR